LASDLLRRDSKPTQYLDANPFTLTDHPEEQVLRTNIVVSHPSRFFDRYLQHLFSSWSQFNPA
jgi:hypothetical protein